MAACNIKDTKSESNGGRKCSLCKEVFKKPRLLPCQHSFCTSCLKTHIQEREAINFLCPTCDLEVSLPPKGIESLPENYLHQILATRSCVCCKVQGKTHTADLQCLDCEDAVCNECQDFHKTPGLRNHRLVSIKELESGNYKKTRREKNNFVCKKHSEGTGQHPLKYYCKDCKTLKCDECILHEEIFSGKETFYEEKLGRLLKNLKGQQDIVGVIQMVENRIHEKRAAIENKIYDKATEIQELVEKVKNEKLTLVNEHFEKELQKIKILIEKERNQLKRLESTEIFVQDFMKNSTEGEYLMYEEDVKTRMADYIIERERFVMMTVDLILKGYPALELEHALGDVFGQPGAKRKVTDITGYEWGAEIELVVKGKIKLNLYVSGIAVAENGDIIAVGGSKIEILNKDGESKKVIECKELNHAWSVILKNDLIFVTDNGQYSEQLLVLDLDGHIRNAIRMPDDDYDDDYDYDNDYEYGVGITVDDRDTIYVCLQNMSAIYTCTLDNTELKLFTSEQHQPDLKGPHNLSMTLSRHLVVTNSSSNKIQVYNDQAELLWQFDNKDIPFGLCCDMAGHIFIGSYDNSKIRVVKDRVLKGIIEIPDVYKSNSLAINKDGDLLVCHRTNEITKVSLWG